MSQKRYAQYDVQVKNGAHNETGANKTSPEFAKKEFVKHVYMTDNHAEALNRLPEVGVATWYELDPEDVAEAAPAEDDAPAE